MPPLIVPYDGFADKTNRLNSDQRLAGPSNAAAGDRAVTHRAVYHGVQA